MVSKFIHRNPLHKNKSRASQGDHHGQPTSMTADLDSSCTVTKEGSNEYELVGFNTDNGMNIIASKKPDMFSANVTTNDKVLLLLLQEHSIPTILVELYLCVYQVSINKSTLTNAIVMLLLYAEANINSQCPVQWGMLGCCLCRHAPPRMPLFKISLEII